MDTKKIEPWLEAQPRNVCVAIAYRAAMRILPLATHTAGTTDVTALALANLRAALISGVAGIRPTSDIASAALSASSARSASSIRFPFSGYSAASSAFGFALSAVHSEDFVRSASFATSSAAHALGLLSDDRIHEKASSAAKFATAEDTRRDPTLLAALEIPLPTALRSIVNPVAMAKDAALQLGGPWTFWTEWYTRAMAGDPLDWKLQEQIALIPDEVWEAGPEAVAKEIRRIQLGFVSSSLPQAGEIAFDEDAEHFRKVPKPAARPPLLGATLEQVEGALEDALADPSNGLHNRSREVQVLRRMLDRFGNDPQRIEMDCTSVYGSLTRQLTSEDLPPSEQNLALRDATNQVAEGIRATDPEIAENRRILSDVKFRNMGEDGISAFQDALPILEAVSDEGLGAELREDILFLAEQLPMPEKPVLGTEPRNPGIRAAYDEEIRVFKRVADMAILAKTGDIAKRCGERVKQEPISFIGILVTLALAAAALIGGG